MLRNTHDKAFGADGVDYAMLQKIYGNEPAGQKRYSPAQCLGAKKLEIRGEPNPAHVKVLSDPLRVVTWNLSWEHIQLWRRPGRRVPSELV